MAYTHWEIVHTPFRDNVWDDANNTTLTEFHLPFVRQKLGDTKDTFGFRVTNTFGDYDSFFNPNDRVTIRRVLNSSTVTTSDTVMVGSIKDIPQEDSHKNEILKVEGTNFSESVTSAIVFVNFRNLTVDNALQLALNNAMQNNPNFAVTWHPDNPSVKTDGSAFPTISDERFFYKPLRDVLEKYSTTDMTEDTNYYWYVDEQNRLVWRPRQGTVDATFDVSTDPYYSLKVGKDISGIRNYIILKGGTDPVGNQIMTKYVNWASVNSVGVKFHFYISETNKARNLIMEDLRSSYGDDIGSNTLPTFPFTTSWNARFTYTTNNEAVSVTKGAAVSVNNSDEYVEVIRTEIKKRLVEEGKLFADAVQYGKLTVQLSLPAGSKSWTLGTNILCTIPSLRSTDFTLRVSEVVYQPDEDTFVLIEDEGTVGQGDES